MLSLDSGYGTGGRFDFCMRFAKILRLTCQRNFAQTFQSILIGNMHLADDADIIRARVHALPRTQMLRATIISRGSNMATKKTPAPKAKAAAKKPAGAASKPAKATEMKPIKDSLSKAALIAHLAQHSGVEPKAVKAVMAVLEATTLASVAKKGLGEFTLPGLVKIVAQKVAAKSKRFGKNPFTGQEQWFPAKPATVRVKVRPLKKLKDAAL